MSANEPHTDEPTVKRPVKFWYGVALCVGLAIWALENGHPQQAAFSLLMCLLMIAAPSLAAKRPPLWLMYVGLWVAPALVAAFCVLTASRRDYWGTAIGSVVLGFAIVNSALLEPSLARTRLYRALTCVLVIVSLAAAWKTLYP